MNSPAPLDDFDPAEVEAFLEPPVVEAKVERIPNCDFPHEEPTPALYDASTTQGPWAYMCQEHFDHNHRGGLGLGLGQKLVLR